LARIGITTYLEIGSPTHSKMGSTADSRGPKKGHIGAEQESCSKWRLVMESTNEEILWTEAGCAERLRR